MSALGAPCPEACAVAARDSSPPGDRFFVAVMADESLAARIETFRAWARETLGCRSGQRTPPHVTLVPPFALPPGSLDGLVSVLTAAALAAVPFVARVEGFNSFGERTLFARVVPGPDWDSLRDVVYGVASSQRPVLAARFPHPRVPFHPHLTIANRDIPPGSARAALSELRARGFSAEMPVDHIALLQFEGGAWREVIRCALGGA